jgi:hypothetical protein
MMIKGILILGFMIILSYALSQRRRSRFVASAMVIIVIVGVVSVMYPELTGDVAHAVGVGRGADLILYCFVLATLVAILNLHLRLRAVLEMTTNVTRAVALASAMTPTAKPETSG